MPTKLTPEYHQFIGTALSQFRADTSIISDLVTKFGLSIQDSKDLINTVIALNDQAKGTLAETVAVNNVRISTINPYIKQMKERNNVLKVDGREINILMSMENPEVILLENFLDHIECQHLIDLAMVGLTKSTVAVHGQGQSTLSDYRTSDSTGLIKGQDDIVKNIEDRISILFNWNNNDTDSLQILRYRIGEQYKPHHDFFADGSTFVRGVGERVATLILYLGDPTRGGTTYFPELNLHIHCKKGSALFFAYPNPTPQSKTLHAGTPVIEGTKWIATKWFRSLDKQI